MKAPDLLEHVGRRAFELAGPAGLPPCATEEEVTAAEEVLGFGFHELHRRLLLEIADGGFGPGIQGIFGLSHVEEGDETCLSTWHSMGGRDTSQMPADTVPLADLGCGTWILVHAASPIGAIRFTASQGIYELDRGLADLLGAWLDGVEIHTLLHDVSRAPVREGINPFTKQPIRMVGVGPPFGRLILESSFEP